MRMKKSEGECGKRYDHVLGLSALEIRHHGGHRRRLDVGNHLGEVGKSVGIGWRLENKTIKGGVSVSEYESR